jgi:uncharacterized protein YutD
MNNKKEYLRFIHDPLLEPYFISMDDYCLTVNVKITPDENYTNSGKDYNKVVGHYSNLSNALKSIIKEKTNSKSYSSLEEYITEYNLITKSITNKF